MSFITGVGLTPFGKHAGSSSLDLMSRAAELAITDAGLRRAEIDGILCGYSTVSPHIMLATVFAEHFGIRPAYAHAVQVGGATGLAMTMLARHLVEANVGTVCIVGKAWDYHVLEALFLAWACQGGVSAADLDAVIWAERARTPGAYALRR